VGEPEPEGRRGREIAKDFAKDRIYASFARRALRVAAPLDWDKGTLSAARRGGSYQRSRVFPSPPSSPSLSLSLSFCLSALLALPRPSFVYPRFAARRCYRLTSSSYWFYLSRTHPAGPRQSASQSGPRIVAGNSGAPDVFIRHRTETRSRNPREPEALLARLSLHLATLSSGSMIPLHETHLEI